MQEKISKKDNEDITIIGDESDGLGSTQEMESLPSSSITHSQSSSTTATQYDEIDIDEDEPILEDNVRNYRFIDICFLFVLM